MANRIIAIDPSGTGTTGIFFTDGKKQEFKEFKDIYGKNHYNFIVSSIKAYRPNLLLFENSNYISNRTKDSLNLIRLLGAIETLPIKQVASVNVLKVKELSKQLLRGIVKIKEVEYLPGRGKGGMFNKQRVSIHCLEAFLVWYLGNNC